MSLTHLPLLDFDNLFYSDPDAKVIQCGVKTYTNTKQIDTFLEDVFKEDQGELKFAASCECGLIVGNYCIGAVCPKCNTEVRESFAGELKFKAWVEIPKYMPPFLHPVAYTVIRKWMGTVQKRNLIDMLLDITSELPANIKEHTGCGYRNFVDNFDKIINFFVYQYKPFQKNDVVKARSAKMLRFIEMYRHCLFVRHLPILNPHLCIMTTSGSRKYIDDPSQFITKAIVELANLAYMYATEARTEMYLEQQTYDVFLAHAAYVNKIVYTKITTKPGFIRKHLLGFRCHFTFRGVIVPITCEHSPDELHVPWRIGLGSLKLEIINLLQRRHKFSINSALEKWHSARFSYDPLIDNCMKTLIQECVDSEYAKTCLPMPMTGLATLLGRNP